MRKFLAVLVVVAVLGIGVDFLAGRAFETRTRQLVQERFDLTREPVVQVRDFPFLLSLARGRLGTVDVAVGEVDAGSLALDQLQLELRDVSVPRQVLLGRQGTVSAQRASGRVRITEDEVNRLVARQLGGAEVELGGGSVTIRVTVDGGPLAQPVPVSVLGVLSARGGRVVFLPQEVEAGGVALPESLLDQLNQRVDYRLPELPGGLVPDRVTIEPGALVVNAHLDSFSIRTG